MTQVGEGQDADEAAPPMTTFGGPTVGEILAERYELVDHINDDSAGRQVWRGIDVVLRRPVAVVLRYPGGDSAQEMLQAAVAASRVIHPSLVGVYDAIDEDERAYVVREWVDGQSLRELVGEGLLDPARATSVAHAVAGAVAAVHATGMVHGNVHPGTVMVGDDSRVVLADARTDGAETRESDIRAIGGILYFALTGRWPHAEVSLANGSTRRVRSLPDAMRDANGALAAPRQIRAGIPTYLDDLIMDLLDGQLAVPTSDVLAAELGRLDTPAEDQYLDNTGPLRFTGTETETAEPVPAGGRKIAVGVAGLLVIAVIGLLLGIKALSGGGDANEAGTNPTASADIPADNSGSPAPSKAQTLQIAADQVRIIDPDGSRSELDGAGKAVDGNSDEGWETESYVRHSNFGNTKQGMGVFIDLKQPRAIKSVQVLLSTPGASARLFGGTTDYPSSTAGDKDLVKAYVQEANAIGQPFDDASGVTMLFSGSADVKFQYLLFWITNLPQSESDSNRYKVGVQEITVQAQ